MEENSERVLSSFVFSGVDPKLTKHHLILEGMDLDVTKEPYGTSIPIEKGRFDAKKKKKKMR